MKQTSAALATNLGPMQIRVRTRLHRVLSPIATEALNLLAEHERARVGMVTELTDDGVVINAQTALSLLRFDYVEREGEELVITRAGLIKAGKVEETPGERRQRAARESLEAQESGEWVPAKAGASAAAERERVDGRRFKAQAFDNLIEVRQTLAADREWLKESRDWDDEEGKELMETMVKLSERELAEAQEDLKRLADAA